MKISTLKTARDDLREIRGYLAEFGESPPQKFRTAFTDFCKKAADMPYMFHRCEYAPDYRVAPIAFEYLAFYKVNGDENKIELYRVLHGKRNMPPTLKNDKEK